MGSRVRVLHLGSPTGLYGAERWILALTRYLSPARIESIVGVIRDDGQVGTPPLLDQAATRGLETVSIDAPGRFNPRAISQLRTYLLDQEIDIVHTHFYKSDLIGLLAARGTRCRTVTTPHGWSVDAGFALRVYEKLDRMAFPFFDAIVPLSQDLLDGLSSRVRLRARLVLNGVDIGEIDAVKDLAPEALAWKGRGEFVIGYIGQLIPRKDLETLLRAFAASQCRDQRSSRLVLVGDGEQRSELQSLAETLGVAERTTFMGYREDRLQLLRGFDVFVLPSRLEGIPRCVMEAMAANVPVIASDIPGSRELLDSGSCGVLVPPGDFMSLASAIDAMMVSADRASLAGVARSRVLEHYSAQAVATQYTAVYEELCRLSARHG